MKRRRLLSLSLGIAAYWPLASNADIDQAVLHGTHMQTKVLANPEHGPDPG